MSLLRKAFVVNSAELVSLVIALLQTIVLTRALGPAGIGQYTIILSVILLAPQISGLGIPMSFLYHSQHDPQNTKNYLKNAFRATFCSGILGGVILATLISRNTNYFGPISLPVLICIGCYLPIHSTKILVRNSLLIQLEAQKLAVFRIATMTCRLLSVLIFLWFGVLNPPLAILSLILAETITMLWGLTQIKNYIDLSVKFCWKIFLKLAAMGIRLNWSDMMVLLNGYINILIIKYLLDNFENVGYFSRAQSIAMLMVTAGRAILPLLFSRWASLPREKVTNHVEIVFRFASTIVLILTSAILLCGKGLILVLYGKEFLPATVAMIILVPGAALYLLSRISLELLGSRGNPEIGAIVLFVGALVNACLCWLFIPLYGIAGAAWASTAGNIILFLLLIVITNKKYGVRLTHCFVMRREDFITVLKQFKIIK